jgi:signal transduction histidine kinase
MAQTLLENLQKQSDDLDDTGAPRLRELAEKVVNGITRTHQEVQAISRGLIPLRLDSQGLTDTLRELAFRTDDLEGVTCAFKCEEPVEVADTSTATHLYRIAQEAVANALKHGLSEHILIALEANEGHPILEIADDGAGFDSADETEGAGLKIMLYRASLIGATVTVKPVENGGTLVRCQVFGGK